MNNSIGIGIGIDYHQPITCRVSSGSSQSLGNRFLNQVDFKDIEEFLLSTKDEDLPRDRVCFTTEQVLFFLKIVTIENQKLRKEIEQIRQDVDLLKK